MEEMLLAEETERVAIESAAILEWEIVSACETVSQSKINLP